MRTTILFLAIVLLACEASPQAAAAPTETPSVAPEFALSSTPTPIRPLDTPTPVFNILTPAPTPTVINATAYLRLLQEFGSEFWSGVEYICDVEDYLGACVAYAEAERTHIYFEINFWNREATTIRIGERNEDWIAGCTYPDFEHWNKALGHFSRECSDRRVEKGKAVAGLNKMLAEKWPALVGKRVVPPTPTPKPTITPIPTIAIAIDPTATPYPDQLNLNGQGDLITRFDQIGFTFETNTDPVTDLEYIVGEYKNVTLTIASKNDLVRTAELNWKWEESEDLVEAANIVDRAIDFLEIHIDPFDQSLCIWEAYPDALPITAMVDPYDVISPNRDVIGFEFFVTLSKTEDGQYSLKYTHWLWMPAVDPNDRPIKCE